MQMGITSKAQGWEGLETCWEDLEIDWRSEDGEGDHCVSQMVKGLAYQTKEYIHSFNGCLLSNCYALAFAQIFAQSSRQKIKIPVLKES